MMMRACLWSPSDCEVLSAMSQRAVKSFNCFAALVRTLPEAQQRTIEALIDSFLAERQLRSDR